MNKLCDRIACDFANGSILNGIEISNSIAETSERDIDDEDEVEIKHLTQHNYCTNSINGALQSESKSNDTVCVEMAMPTLSLWFTVCDLLHILQSKKDDE